MTVANLDIILRDVLLGRIMARILHSTCAQFACTVERVRGG